MGKPSRDKGARGERELAALLPGATKISGMYKAGPDLVWRNRTIEVKRRREGFKFDYRHLQDAQILAKRSDRNEWLLTMTIDTLLDLLATCKHGHTSRHVVVHSPSNPQYCEGGTEATLEDKAAELVRNWAAWRELTLAEAAKELYEMMHDEVPDE